MARFVEDNAGVIRHRFRSQLSPQLQRMVDTGDILSTVFRRTQHYLHHTPLRAETTGGMWKLIEVITQRAAVQYGRKHAAARNAERQWWREHAPSKGQTTVSNPTIERPSDPLEQDLVRLRAEGLTHAQIASSLAVSEDVVRQRWSRMRRRVLDQWRDGGPS